MSCYYLLFETVLLFVSCPLRGYVVTGSKNLSINNIFKVPEIPKKPEEKVPVPIPKKEKAPPAKGTSLCNTSVE